MLQLQYIIKWMAVESSQFCILFFYTMTETAFQMFRLCFLSIYFPYSNKCLLEMDAREENGDDQTQCKKN